jgi:UDP:flavonoid glycosyltransferase YjiC (YdhE family)
MRVLITTRGSAGHVLPLAPFGHALRRAGHEVIVAVQRRNAHNVTRTGLPFAPVDDPRPDRWTALLERFAELGIDEANTHMIGRYFGGIDTEAALPGTRAIVEDWRPDVIVRESCEFASTLVAEHYEIPLARVALGITAMENLTEGIVTPGLDALRAELGLAPGLAAQRLRETPYLSMVPPPLEDPASPAPPSTHRFAPAPPLPAAPLPDWWRGNQDPLVYVTFGSVAAAGHLPYYPALYRAAIEALAPLPVRILLTIGDARDHEQLGPLPANVHVERWVDQDDIAPHAAAIVGHGGYGTTLGALRHGMPLVVVPLFSADQWFNAGAVARCGAGLALDAERHTRRVMALPGDDVIAGLRGAVARVIGEPSFSREAQRVATAMDELEPVDAAVDVLTAIAAAPLSAR